MFATLRRVFGPAAVAVIIGAIAMVFVFYGVFPAARRGGGGSAVAATVNGDSISVSEFSREYQSRVEFYQSLMQGKADLNMLKQLGLRQQVLESLIQRKLMGQEAERLGIKVSDQEVASKIQQLPYFRSKEGKFDSSQYKQILQANRLSPSGFEDQIRQDLMRERLVNFLRGRAQVLPEEVKQEFLLRKDQRQIEYVFGPKLTKSIAEEILAKTKSSSGSQLSAFAKSKGAEFKTSDKFSVQQGVIPGIGEASEIVSDAFKEAKLQVQYPKLYETRGTYVIVKSIKSFKPVMADFEKEKDTITQQVVGRKEQAILDQWVSNMRTQAKVAINKAVTDESSE